ncbi:MAG: NAD-dependent epimerase/dehydratase family protein, partial [Solirubrobacterales bacterium]|nr:NAD-dependent epimerase/dehydratase family protein [Solirubrobacterales bacterium]
MNRVLVTGGAGTIGAAVVRRLLGDPAYEVRVSDQRDAPTWMREGCEVHTGDLRILDAARKATAGCNQVIHL